jgi:hypothetical protein
MRREGKRREEKRSEVKRSEQGNEESNPNPLFQNRETRWSRRLGLRASVPP